MQSYKIEPEVERSRSISRILSSHLRGEAVISLMRPTRHWFTGVKNARATRLPMRTSGRVTYMVLHRAGFVVPPPLLAARWSLTPPFHLFLCVRHVGTHRCVFSVTLSVRTGCCSCDPRLTRGTVPFGVRTFLIPLAEANGTRLPDRTPRPLAFALHFTPSCGAWYRCPGWRARPLPCSSRA